MSRLIVTLSSGDEAARMEEISVPFMRTYADKVDADFEILRETDITTRLGPHYEKMRIGQFLESYDAVLFIDLDILVTPWARDIFEQVSGRSLAAVSIEDVYSGLSTQRRLIEAILGEVSWQKPYFNSGVFIVHKDQRELFDLEDGLVERYIAGQTDMSERGLNDQNILNYRVNTSDHDVEYLDRSFNFTRSGHQFHHRFSKDFIHYAGFHGVRLAMMGRDSEMLRRCGDSLQQRSAWTVRFMDAVWKRTGWM